MAGYRRQSTIYNLVFKEFEGLTVTIKGLNTGQMMQLWDGTASAASTKEAVATKATKDMLRMFVNALIEWNLEDEKGTPVPPTLEGVESQDLPFVMAIISAWTTALAGTDEELGKDLDSGKQFPEALIPMATS